MIDLDTEHNHLYGGPILKIDEPAEGLSGYERLKNKKYKHIFVDFDSTLYLWDDSPEREDIEDVDWYALLYMKGDAPYNPEQLNTILINYLKHSDADIHLVTWSYLSLVGKIKYDFVNKHYPGLLKDWTTTATPAHKAFLLEVYEKAGISRDEMLLIDDKRETIRDCRAKGFDIQEPQFIMGMLYNQFPKIYDSKLSEILRSGS